MFVPSAFNTAISNFVKHEKGSLVVQADAGTGKTAQIEFDLRNTLTPEQLADSIYLVFGKKNQLEFEGRMPKGARCSTMHSLGFRALRSTGMRFKLEGNKVRDIVKAMREWGDISAKHYDIYADGVVQLVALAKGIVMQTKAEGQNFPGITRDTDEAWFKLIEHYEVTFDQTNGEEPDDLVGVNYARDVLAKSTSVALSRGVIDFNDQLYLPLLLPNAHFDKYGIIFIDEAQDTNLARRALAKASLRKGGRVIAVGDRRQAIFGFTGADSASMDMIRDEFNAKELPLSINYRCDAAIVRAAQTLSSTILPRPNAPEGIFESRDKWSATELLASDGIICRNTAPLLEVAYQLIAQGVPCRVVGRDIGKGLVRLIEILKPRTIEQLEEKLEHWYQSQVERLTKKGQEDKIQPVEDKRDSLNAIILHRPANVESVGDLIGHITAMFQFDDVNPNIVTLSTIHRAKGLEWERVWVLNPSAMPSAWARQAWQVEQEMNLKYVAYTRGKHACFLVEAEDFNKK